MRRLLLPAACSCFEEFGGQLAFSSRPMLDLAKSPETCPFLGFLKRSNCALEKFQSDIPGDEEQVENIALALPSLVDFRIEALGDSCSRFGASLQQKFMEGKALPMLRVLSTWWSDDISGFLDMVEARSQPSTEANPEISEGEGAVSDRPVSKLEYVKVNHGLRILKGGSARIDSLREQAINHVQTIHLPERLDVYVDSE
ncbi:hypothetical protein FA13DRAFT_1785053 [Coprinellus micaceus]|uniref:Uncharacterized protein n=1 Tax=Coprinellus micaceus TaxID=71717 RepID=A0A4Y7TX67_COPMI|nr:hypothetical protein FA13DRAFT_1785053 [Coprinellus micaceus]